MAGAPFDLVLTDLHMNGLGGLDLLAQLSTRANSPPTLVITACDSAGELRAARLLGAYRIVQKPFSLTALRTAIDAALQDLLAAA
jgi:DNA-binding response OmpR family regulator